MQVLASLVLSALGMSKVLEGTLYPMPDLAYRRPISDVEFERRMSNILDVVTKNQGGVPITEARRAVLTQAFEPVSSDNPDVGDLKELFVNALAAAPAIPSSQSEEALYYMRYYYRHQAIALDGRTVYGHWYDEKWLSDISQRLAIAQHFFLSVNPTTTSTTTTGYPAWNATAAYQTWPSSNDIQLDDAHLVVDVVELLTHMHRLIPLDASHKTELLHYLALFELSYGHLEHEKDADFDALRKQLDVDVELSSDVNYAAFLKAEGELLRELPFCLVDLERCRVSLEGTLEVLGRELEKAEWSLRSTTPSPPSTTLAPPTTLYAKWNLDLTQWPESFTKPWADALVQGLLKFLAETHHEFRLPQSLKQEMLRFLAFLEERYPTNINKNAVEHLNRLRHNLALPFKVQERLDYDKLLEAERYVLQNIHKCFEVVPCKDVYDAVGVIESQLERVVRPRVLRHVNSKPLFGTRLRNVAA